MPHHPQLPEIKRCKRLDEPDPPQFMRPGVQGRWSRLRSSGCGTDGIGVATRDSPQAAPKKGALRLRCRRSTELSRLQRQIQVRRVPCSARVLPNSGRHGEVFRRPAKPAGPAGHLAVRTVHCGTQTPVRSRAMRRRTRGVPGLPPPPRHRARRSRRAALPTARPAPPPAPSDTRSG